MRSILRSVKWFMLLGWMGLTTIGRAAGSQDAFPPPAAHIQTIPAGAYIIAMDKTLQGNGTNMNLKAYGLAAKLLWNDVHIKWAIRAGKAKDGIDFTTSAQRVYPTAGSSASLNFKSGPFIIMPEDTAVAGPIIRAYNAALAAASRVNIYRLNSATDIDIRYTLTHKPLVGIYDDGGNANIHEENLIDAGFDAAYWRVLPTGVAIDSTSCYTFASTPHWGEKDYTDPNVILRLDNLKNFLNSGGNFFAQCEGIDAVEDYPNQKYQTTEGFNSINTGETTPQYANADMPVMQFDSTLTPIGGSVHNYILDVGSVWLPTRYTNVYFLKNIDAIPGLDTVWISSSAKYTNLDSIGGTVTYLGGHNYKNTGGEQNGERIYLNAIFMPAIRPIFEGTAFSNSPLCQGDTLKLGLNPPFNGWTFEWSGPQSFSSTLQYPTRPNVVPAMSGIYTGYLVDATGCKVGYPVDVVISTKPDITASAAPSTICAGNSTTLSVSPTSGLTIIGWFTGCTPTGANLGATSSITVTPASTTTYSVVVSNSQGCRDTACVTVTVNAKPDITASLSINSVCRTKSAELSFTPTAGLTVIGWFADDEAPGCNPTGNSLGNTPTLTVTPAVTTSYTVVVENAFGCRDTAACVTLEVLDCFPEAIADSYTLPEDAPATNLPVLTNDDFGGNGPSTGSITITSNPSHGTATVNNGGTPNDPTDDQITYTPTANYNGPDALIYQICDSDGDCDTALVSITVTSVDDFPIANADSYSLPEDAPATNLPVLTNDDFGGDGPSSGTITITSNPAHGTATVNDGGTANDPTDDQITYTPTANYNGPDQLIYRICDSDGDCDTAIVYLNITSVDDFPIANADTYTLPEDAPATNLSVLTNDDFGGDGPSTGTIFITSNPSHGTATVNNGGTPNDPTDDQITYTPTANYNGPDALIYQICDSDGDCDTAIVRLTITSVDDFPVANADTYNLPEDAPATNLPVLTNDDFGGDGPSTGTITITSNPSHGTATVNNGGTPNDPTDDQITYTPTTNYNGPDQLIYQICDSDNDCDTAIVYLSIDSDNDAPVVQNDRDTTCEDTPATGDVSLNDTDLDGPGKSITLVSGPSHGSINLNLNGTYTYTPALNYNGNDTVVYSYCDLGTPNLCDTASLFIVVTPVNDSSAKDKTVECDGNGNVADLLAWLASNGGATPGDACFGCTWTNDFDSLSNGCGATGSARVTFTLTYPCGTRSTTATFRIIDTTDPVIDTTAKNKTVECDGNGNVAELQAWLSANGGASASDICSGDVTWSNDFDSLSNGCGATGSARVTFTATDACGNSSSTTATFTIVDTTDPQIDTAAKNKTVECDGAGNLADLQAWLNSNGGASASDICSGTVTWSNDFDTLSNGCGATGSARVTFTATDACGNSASTTATFTIVDTTDPVLDTEASDKSVECDGQGNVAALQAWLASNGGASASDICSGTVTWSNDFDSLSNGCGATGSARVTFTASDECGNTVSTTATFSIIDTTGPVFISTLPGDITVCDIVPVPPVIRASDNCGSASVSLTETIDSVTIAGVKIYTRKWTASDECDNKTTHTQTITVNSSVVINIDSTICEGETVTIGNNTYSLTGTYQNVFTTTAGCDSTVNLYLTVNPVKYTNIDAVICQGEQVIAGGQVFTTSVTDSVIVLTTSLGCDSILTVNIQVLGQDTIIANRTICDGGSVTIGDSTYSETGTYYIEFQNNQCTGIVQLNLSVNSNTASTLNESICEGEVYLLAGNVFATAGTYTVTIDNSQGCDSVITLNLRVNPTVRSQVDTAICRGESITIGQSTFNTSGNYQVTLANSLGCDSIVSLNLIVLDNGDTTFVNQTICQGDSVVINNQVFKQAGVYYISVANGRCTNFVELTLNVKPVSKTTLTEAICQGESIVVGGQTFTQTGTYTINLTNSVGCDSTITLNLDVSQGGVKTELDTAICEGSSVTFAGQTFSTTGVYQIIYPSGVCRDTLLLRLIVNPAYRNIRLDSTICEGESVVLGGNAYTLTGVYAIPFTTIHGCDSIVNLHLTVNPVKRTNIDAVICFGDQVVVGGNAYTTSVTNEVVTLGSVNGCDSIITLNLVVLKQDTIVTDRTICEGDFVDIGGNIFDESGTYYIPFQNNQCTGIARLNLLVLDNSEATLDRTICTGENVVVAGHIYNASGSYAIHTANAAGCDSLIILNLTVNPVNTTRIDTTICRGEAVTVGTQVFNQSGSYTVTLSGAGGCDSNVNLNLSVLDAGDTSRITQTICENESIIVAGQEFDQAGVYYIATPNGNCTNYVELTLAVRPVSATSLSQTICAGQAVVVGSQTFTETGKYTVALKNAFGCDSIVTLDLQVSAGGLKTQVDTAICAGGSVTFAGQTFTQTGTYQVVYPSGVCRDTLLVNLTVNKVYEISETRSICSNRPDSILWEGQYYSVPGTYTQSFTSAQGCDSIRVLNLDANLLCPRTDIDTTVYDSIPVFETDTVCVNTPGGPNLEIQSCTGSTSGTGNYGTWTIDPVTGCLYYEAGTIKGNDTICVSACDTLLQTCVTTTVIITVTGLPPIAEPDSATTVYNTPVIIPVQHNDSSPDNDTLQWCDGTVIVTQPGHGTVVVNSDGTITYTPAGGFLGVDSLQYRVCDPDGADTAWVIIVVNNCEIPNAFSPNGDGINETFIIPCADGPVFLDVFNRWGIEVFRSETYDNSWNGTYKGAPLPDGTYYYVLRYKNTQGQQINHAAFVVIHR